MKKINLFIVCLLAFAHQAGAHGLPRSRPVTGSFVASPANGITVAGGNGTGSALNQLNSPLDVFVDAFGNIYVVETYNSRVTKWAPGAKTGTIVAGGNGQGSAANQLDFPSGVFVDPVGNVYVADASNNRIQKWAPGASSGLTVAGGHGAGPAANQLWFPTGVFVDISGNVYVAEYPNNRIQKWAPGATTGITVAGGNGKGSAANQFDEPDDVFVDAVGNIFIADASNHRVQEWKPGASSGITVAGGNGSGPAANQLYYPNGIYLDSQGNIYIADGNNFRIQKWVPGATEGITVAGGNGPGSAANQFNYPGGPFIDAAGNLYVADRYNERIQKFILSTDLPVCPANLTVAAPSCSGKVAIRWIEPHDTFPAAIGIPGGVNLPSGILIYKGTFNGHGYYQSNDIYSGFSAHNAATAAGAHLVTITSPEENNFILTNLNQRNNSAWIGLANTGKVGSFAWITGELVNYTNWIPGEPDNLWHDPLFVHEPYVHINGWADPDLCRWNDIGNELNSGFIAEFESTEHTYRQISGPANGSEQTPGVYTICYQRLNTGTRKIDTCCFSITVTCNAAVVDNAQQLPATADVGKGLRVLTAPNPSSTSFRLNIISYASERISIQVTDIWGRRIESKNNISSNQALQLGATYPAGVYFARVIQGNNSVTLRLVKQNN